MRRILVTVLIAASAGLFVPAPCGGQAENPKLGGITTVNARANLAMGESGTPPVGLSSERLQTMLELRLRSAGLRISPAKISPTSLARTPTVLLDVTMLRMQTEDGEWYGYVFTPHLWVFLAGQRVAFNNSIAHVVLYEETFLRTVGRVNSTDEIESALGAMIDNLANAWLEANPRR